MPGVHQIPLRDLFWLTLVCALCALFIRRHDRTVAIDRVVRTETVIVDEAAGERRTEVHYNISIDALDLSYGTSGLPAKIVPMLDRIAERRPPQVLHLGPPPSPPGQGSP